MNVLRFFLGLQTCDSPTKGRSAKARSALFFALLYGALLVGCTEVSQILNPSPVDVNVATPGMEPTSPTLPGGASGTIALDPANITLDVSQTVNVQVTVRDSGGTEVPSENISVSIFDKSILRLVQIDGRIIAFEGLASGVTSVIVTASGLQTSLVATVSPLAQSSVAILSDD